MISARPQPWRYRGRVSPALYAQSSRPCEMGDGCSARSRTRAAPLSFSPHCSADCGAPHETALGSWGPHELPAVTRCTTSNHELSNRAYPGNKKHKSPTENDASEIAGSAFHRYYKWLGSWVNQWPCPSDEQWPCAPLAGEGNTARPDPSKLEGQLRESSTTTLVEIAKNPPDKPPLAMVPFLPSRRGEHRHHPITHRLPAS